MRRAILIILVLLFAAPAWGQMIVGGGEANTELGNLTVGINTATGSARGIDITVPAGGITVRYGYVYCSSTQSDTFEMAVYQTDGTQVGTCSALSPTVVSTAGWVEVAFTPFHLSAGNYIVQYHTTGGKTTITNYYNNTGSGQRYGNDACGILYSTNTSTRIVTMSIANYRAH